MTAALQNHAGFNKPALSAESASPAAALLYATSAGLGGSGLDVTSYESLLAAANEGFLAKALCFANRQRQIPHRLVRSLHLHPVRLLSCLGSRDYYAAKKRALDRAAARWLRSGRFDLFHGWSSECLDSLIEARRLGVPSVIDVPTWHRNKGMAKPAETKSERQARLSDRGWRDWRKHLPVTRLQQLAEYDLATVLLMPSLKSRETFLAAGIPEHRLRYVGRGVNLAQYAPSAEPPEKFRAVFVGALIRRKGVHHLLDAWKRLALKDAELVLVGSPQAEMKPWLDAAANDASVKITGFSANVQHELRAASVFVFPSECEGFAKATIEAAACGLPLIATRESGDAIIDGETGVMIPPNDVDALAAALLRVYRDRDHARAMGVNANRLVRERFTWEHHRARLLEGYAQARRLA